MNGMIGWRNAVPSIFTTAWIVPLVSKAIKVVELKRTMPAHEHDYFVYHT
jgi:hypothetical protein